MNTNEQKDCPIQESGEMDRGSDALRDELKMIEISEAIHDLDAKLTNLENILRISDE